MNEQQRKEIMDIIRSGNPEYVPAPNYVKPDPITLLAKLEKRDEALIASGRKPVWRDLFLKLLNS